MDLDSSSKTFLNLISPISDKIFYENYWEKNPLFIKRKDSYYYQNILTVQDMNYFLKRNDIRYPTIRLVKDGSELPLEDYSKNITLGRYISEGLINNDKLFHFLNERATVLFQLVHNSVPSLSKFANSLEKYFNFRVYTNVYITPQNSQGIYTTL
ncbi:MAG: hypothetical protein IPK10_17515 [Bacteroidetes bacterium]|nr:hypothetical protein [Bacteroidota bacterium]